MADQHAIGFIGYPAAGKSTSVDLLNDHFEASAIAIGDVVRAHLEDQWGYEPDGPEIRDWVTTQLEQDDEAVIERVVARLDDRSLESLVLVDGIRTPADVRVLDQHFDQFTLIYIDVPDDIRLRRIQERGRDDEADFTMEDLKDRDADEEAWGLDTIVEEEWFDERIDGYGGDYESRLVALVEELRS